MSTAMDSPVVVFLDLLIGFVPINTFCYSAYTEIIRDFLADSNLFVSVNEKLIITWHTCRHRNRIPSIYDRTVFPVSNTLIKKGFQHKPVLMLFV